MGQNNTFILTLNLLQQQIITSITMRPICKQNTDDITENLVTLFPANRMSFLCNDAISLFPTHQWFYLTFSSFQFIKIQENIAKN